MNHALELAYTHIPVLVLVEKFPGASEDKIQGVINYYGQDTLRI
jgi:hypothetical protein